MLVLERERFPRFHIGESLLPETNKVFEALGIQPETLEREFVQKLGASFVSADFSAECDIDFEHLDAKVDELVTALAYTFPDCTRKTLQSLRKKKLAHWYANSETNRSWLSLNMNTEAAAGFPAFHFGERGDREADFLELRRRVAAGAKFDTQLVRDILPASARKAMDSQE